MPPSSRSTAVDHPALLALIVGLGLALSGWFIGDGFLRGRSADRYVEVKGLAEREVTAVQLQGLEVSDAFANRFSGERGGPRFVIQQTCS